MSTIELLSAERHSGLKFATKRVVQNPFVPITVEEVGPATVQGPVFLGKLADTGQFYLGTLFGFKAGENLFADERGEHDGYWTLALECDGFLTAKEDLAIDIDNPRFSQAVGEPLFDDDQTPGERLRGVQQLIGRLIAAGAETERFIKVLLEHKLVEPIDISLRFDDGEAVQLDGLYTISLDALRDLDDASVLTLFRQSYLQLAYAINGSLRQIPVLARRRNRRLGGS